jgi:fluoride ion exporter CrcB/FEX
VNAAGIVAVGVGAAFGAWLRWGLGALLNPLFPTLPLGTLATWPAATWLGWPLRSLSSMRAFRLRYGC